MFGWLEFLVPLSGLMLGWMPDWRELYEEPRPPLTEPTPWDIRAEKAEIDRFAVSPEGMWDIVTKDKKHITFFEGKDEYALNWDIREDNDVPAVSFKVRLVPPREIEYEMTLYAKTQQQLWDLRIPEGTMYRYLSRNSDELEIT